MYKRILVAVDGSENSIRVAEHTAYIASLNSKATVKVLYILDYERIRTDAIHNIGDDTLHIDQETKLAPIKMVFEKKRVAYELVIKKGDPGSTIVSFANKGGFNLVIIGSRGLDSFQEMVLGSVSHTVAKRGNMPVLIVK